VRRTARRVLQGEHGREFDVARNEQIEGSILPGRAKVGRTKPAVWSGANSQLSVWRWWPCPDWGHVTWM
jgi:hypothetical protein